MIGLDAISANNGWAMAVTGAIIVMSGLTILSLIISQLHKLIALFEKKVTEEPAAPIEPPPSYAQLSAEADILHDLDAAARIYQALLGAGEQNFSLQKLYQISAKEQMPHPHLTIRALRDAGFLLPSGEGLYHWKQS